MTDGEIIKRPDGSKNTSSMFVGKFHLFRYRGDYYDVETQFYYLKTRYYDPETCRFINICLLQK